MSSSLHDLASRLIAFAATDEEYHDILDTLHALAEDEALPEDVRARMGDALFRWVGSTPDTRARAVADLLRIVEAAQGRLGGHDRPALPADAGARSAPDPAGPPDAPAARADRPAGHLLPPAVDHALVLEFIGESRDLLDHAEAALLALEGDPDDTEAVNTIFRAFHTIKGTSAFLALEPITQLAHHAESILSRVREREIRCTGNYADLALQACDMLRALLDASGDALAGSEPPLPSGFAALMRALREPDTAGTASSALPSSRNTSAAVSRRDAPGDGRRADESSVRLRTERLDRLIEMVGELVIAESMLAQDPVVRQGGHLELTRKVTQAGKIVRELQDLSMSLRMVPLRGPFQRVARLVRDLGARSGKPVHFVAEGDETELDRHVVDALTDPLMHMVRNAVDHGIEPAAERRAAGKPERGTVRLSAGQASGMVVVVLEDDGRGLDRARIVRKAIEHGLIVSDDGLDDQQVFALIFAPGFSTADAVTDVSGRGVGMDVVRRNIEALRGRIEISSEPGRGTRFLVRLPFTLAITDGMLVRVGGERYIIPTVGIQLSFRPPPGALRTVAGRGELVLLRDEVLPLVRLHRLFGVPGATEDPTHGLLVVVGDGTRRTALLVDELLGQQHVVAKALGRGVGRVPGIAGGAILGDGRVGLILDVNELLLLARGTGAGEPSLATALAVA